MFRQMMVFLILFSLLFPTLLLLFTVNAYAFLGEESRGSILSLLQGILMMFLLHFFSQDKGVEEELSGDEGILPEGVYFIDTSLGPREEVFFAAINRDRIQEDLTPLELHQDLIYLSNKKAWDLAKGGYFHYHSPTLGSPFAMMREEGISYLYTGENIFKGPTVEKVQQGLMESVTHLYNILERRFTYVGVGIKDSPLGIMDVQLFMQKEL